MASKRAANPHDDVILRHFMWARERDYSLRRKLFLENASQCAGGVEHIQNSACACVVLDSQYEKEWQEALVAPLSQRPTVLFDTPAPRPPKPFNFEDRFEQFAIRDSVKIVTCEECKGSGRTCGERGCTEHKVHEKCEGAGQLVTWQVFNFKYHKKSRKQYIYPDSLKDRELSASLHELLPA
jgi:hypothetical protein